MTHSVYVQGQSDTNRFPKQLTGLANGTVDHSLMLNDDQVTWGPCDAARNLNVVTELRVNAPAGANATVTLAGRQEVIALDMQPCPTQ